MVTLTIGCWREAFHIPSSSSHKLADGLQKFPPSEYMLHDFAYLALASAEDLGISCGHV